MAFDIELRDFKDLCYNKGLALFAGLKPYMTFSPNWITLLSGVTGIICFFLCWGGYDTWAVLLWWLSRILDGLDGAYARLTGKSSDFGGYFDIIIDFTTYAVIPLGVALR